MIQCIIFLVAISPCSSQYIDIDTSNKHSDLWPLVVPAAMIAYGFVALENEHLKSINQSVNGYLKSDNHTTIDDYLIYLPLVADGGLSLSGYKSKHRYIEKIGLYATATFVNASMVYTTKLWSKEARPDGSDLRSFPSGHTSNAFVGAEFFWQEYKDQSPWLAMTGYVVASATGVMRMTNNKHWLSDVVAGAGFGILSTKLVYWAYPKCNKWLGIASESTVVIPTMTLTSVGGVVVYQF